MGIDIYARWKGQSEKERTAQYSVGFSVMHGRVGYLREAYHGEPYATRHLCREAFESERGAALIPAAVLRERLDETLKLAEERERTIYGEKDEKAVAAVLKSFRDFVTLCERKEKETGYPIEIVASY
jgi:hypothetical protein